MKQPLKIVAQTLGVSEKTLRRRVDSGEVHCEVRKVIGEGNRAREAMVDLEQAARALGRIHMLPKRDGHLKNEPGRDGQNVHVSVQAGKFASETNETQTTQTPGQNVHLSRDGQNVHLSADTSNQVSETAVLSSKDSIVENVHLSRDGQNVHLSPKSEETSTPTQKTILDTPLDLAALSQVNVPVVRDPLALPKHVLESAQSRQTWLAELSASLETAKHGEANRLVEAAATAHGLSAGTVWRLLRRNDAGGVTALARKQRADTGKFRLPAWLLELIVTIIMTNPAMSALRLRRTLELYDPALLTYKASPTAKITSTLSSNTIWRVRTWMNSIPTLRYALMTPKSRKEFARVWAGEVFAERANQLWMADMTRCDTFVYDPTSGDVYRLRIHAVIDVYSGAIPSFVFSRAEDQIATNRMITLAVLEKPEPWRERWPVHGRPERLYWDNGKTYRSSRAHLALESLGVEIIHSRPRVSHTRGNIERFFGVYHQTFESNLPGYGGPDTKSRDHDTIKKHLENTVRWLAAGGTKETDPYPNRLMTEEEYKFKALLWLTADYHQQITRRGKTRLEDFLSTATVSSRAKFDFGDLQIIFSKREKRTVRGNGTVNLNNKPYGMADAGLVPYQGREIVVLINDMMPAQELLAAIPEGENLRILGPLSCMDFSALGPEAVQYRRAAREKVANVKQLALELQVQMTDPRYRHDQVLETQNPDVTPPTPGPNFPTQITLSADAPEARLVRDPGEAQRITLENLIDDFRADGFDFDDDLSDMDLPKPDLSRSLASGPRGPLEDS